MQRPSMSHTLTSDEVNFLVYRYLQESGFNHSSYTFGCESMMQNTNINGAEVPPGALISFIQKGIQYLEIETKLAANEDGIDITYERPFDLLTPQSRARIASAAKSAKKEAAAAAATTSKKTATEKAANLSTKKAEGPQPMEEESPTSQQQPTIIPENEVTILRGHESEVFICAWSPTKSLLASGSGDSTARIWTIPPGPSGEEAALAASNPIVLKHSNGATKQESSKDVTTLDWSGDGSMLATGSYDGKARVWTEKGDLKMTLNRHKGPIFSLKWNKQGNYLLSGSVDNTAIIWDVKTGEVKQQFEFHTAPTLDVDWRNNYSFATCSTDKMIYVCKLGETKPLKAFAGHKDEVNAIKWDPSGSLLASCSDDYTAKIWNMKSDTCVQDFREHTKEIYTIKWSPTGPHTDNPNRDLVLASASFDASIKIWDVTAGKCLYSLTEHSDPVYSVSFSPDGQFLASGSFDRCLHIWSVKDGKLVRTYNGSGSIFEVCWNSRGDKVAACFSNNTVCVIDFRM
eukprot:GEZU01025163.1.p1 GENE.GEZU01025163.1~~GEZU01025163.1.p1  ORF type:complete len:516 (-),score=84.30 GEZU01025163.1:1180-2727(-)